MLGFEEELLKAVPWNAVSSQGAMFLFRKLLLLQQLKKVLEGLRGGCQFFWGERHLLKPPASTTAPVKGLSRSF